MASCGFQSLPVYSSVNTMVRLMLGVLVLGNLPVQGLQPPHALRFDSVDYKNVLHWSPPLVNATLNYSVQWKIYGESQWVDMPGCQEVRRLQCDLSGVTSDLREWYYARVNVSSPLHAGRSAWAISRRFSPHWDTKISAPALSVGVTEQGVVVRLKPPAALVHKLRKTLCCRVHVRHSSGKEDKYERKSCTEELLVAGLRAGTRYCIQAQSVVCYQGKSSTRSAPTCITTAP